MVGGQRNLHGVGMQHARVVQHGFESGRGGYHIAAWNEERVIGGAQNFRGAAAQDNIFGLQMYFCASVAITWR